MIFGFYGWFTFIANPHKSINVIDYERYTDSSSGN